MAFGMVLHERLGEASHARALPEDIVQMIWDFPGLHQVCEDSDSGVDEVGVVWRGVVRRDVKMQ